MRFDLKQPCAQCPFRTDIRQYLSAARRREIAEVIVDRQQTFSCHKSVDYSDADLEGQGRSHGKTQHCAGATIMLERMGMPNQMMRIAERLGLYDRSKLEMGSPTFSTKAQFVRGRA